MNKYNKDIYLASYMVVYNWIKTINATRQNRFSLKICKQYYNN